VPSLSFPNQAGLTAERRSAPELVGQPACDRAGGSIDDDAVLDADDGHDLDVVPVRKIASAGSAVN
jgi:hypothetical protein